MRRLHYGWVIVAVSVVAVLGALGFGRFGYTMILPSMAAGLGLSEVQAADLATGNMLGYLLASVVAGMLAAKVGTRRVVSASMALTALAMLLTGLARGYPLALGARILTGLASGGVNVPIMALVTVWFAAGRRGTATGLTVGGSSVALLVTGLLVPWALRVSAAGGWRLGRRNGLALVFAAQMASYALFGLWREPAGRYLSAALFAVTAWSIPAIMVSAVSELLEPRLDSAAYGFLSLFIGIGQFAGPFVAGRLSTVTHSYAQAFLLAAAAALVGAAGSLALPRPPGGVGRGSRQPN